MRYCSFLALFIISLQAFSQQSDFLKVADSLNAVGKTSEAIDLLESNSDQSEKVLLRLAEFQKKSGKDDAALSNYRKVLQKNPDRTLTALDYGELLLETKKLKSADSLFSILSEKYPENAGFRFRLGLAHEKLQDSTAIDDFFKTVELDSTHQGALYKTAKYQLQHGKHFNATALAKRGLKENANNVSLLSILGQSYMVSFQFKKAIESFEKLVELGEGSEFILQNLARAYKSTGQENKAIKIYQKILELSPGDTQVHSAIGVLYLNKGENEKAQEHFFKALQLKNPVVDNEYIYIGLTFKRQKNYELAYGVFKNALKENPNNERALLEVALTADAFMDDKKAVLELYENYVNRYRGSGDPDKLELATFRISDIKKELHMAE